MSKSESTFGERMRHARMTKDWAVEKLADVIGVTENIITDYENGDKTPDSPMANRIAYALDVSVYYLLFGTEYCLKYGYAQ